MDCELAAAARAVSLPRSLIQAVIMGPSRPGGGPGGGRLGRLPGCHPGHLAVRACIQQGGSCHLEGGDVTGTACAGRYDGAGHKVRSAHSVGGHCIGCSPAASSPPASLLPQGSSGAYRPERCAGSDGSSTAYRAAGPHLRGSARCVCHQPPQRERTQVRELSAGASRGPRRGVTGGRGPWGTRAGTRARSSTPPPPPATAPAAAPLPSQTRDTRRTRMQGRRRSAVRVAVPHETGGPPRSAGRLKQASPAQANPADSRVTSSWLVESKKQF